MTSIPLGILHAAGHAWAGIHGSGWVWTALAILVALGPGQFLICDALRRLAGTHQEIQNRVGRSLRKLPLGRRVERPFIGFSRGMWIWPYHAFARQQDSVAIVGPPRSGKSTGILIPQLALWGGSAVSTSIKPDVLAATLRRRRQLAERHGGQVYVYAPTTPGEVCGIEPMSWSPITGCDDPVVALTRVGSLVYSARTGSGTSDQTHWRDGASTILRGLFGAAAVHPTRPGDLRVVLAWLNDQQLDEPAALLRNFGTAGDDRARALEGIAITESKERSSMFSAARMALSGVANPLVLERSQGNAFDVDRFLATCSTLYVVAPTQHQEGIAPLISSLIESIVTRAYELDHQSALSHRLLLSLDEVCNIAPLPTLPAIISQGGGQGCNASWAAQSFAQLRDRYGREAAAAIWSASNARVIYGGIGDSSDLADLARMAGGDGDYLPVPRPAGRPQPPKGRPPVSTRMLREIPDRTALLLYGNRQPYWLKVPRWSRALTLRWTVSGAPAWMASGARLPARIRERLVVPQRPAPKPTPVAAAAATEASEQSE